MKKLFALLLTVAFCAVFAVGCSNRANVEIEQPISSQNTQTEADEDIGATETGMEDEGDASGREGWIELQYGIWIPEPPFSEYESTIQDNICNHTLYFEYVDETNLLNYIRSLPEFGFTVEETGTNNWKAIGPEGQSMHITYEMSAKKGAMGTFSCYPAK